MKLQKSIFYTLLVVTAVILFAHLGKMYVDIMEARNFVSAREMAEEGHWIFTTMNDAPRYEKPPLPTWLSAWMGQLFSFNNIAALRFPAALSCFFLVIYFYKIVDFITKNSKLAIISSLVLITNFIVIYVGRRGNWDIFSYSFMVIGLYYFILALKDIKSYSNYLIAGLLFGCSILCKGPTGPYVFLIPLYLSYVITFGFPKWKEIRGIAFCAVITVVVGFSWYLYIYLADGETLLSILEKETAARGNRDVKPFTRYLSFPVQTGIWVFYSVLGLAFPLMKKRTEQPKVYLFFFYWTVFAFVLLSLIPSKKERYLFPMMVPLAATTGYYLYFLFKSINLKKWELTLNKVIFSILGVVSVAIAIGVYFLPVGVDIYVVLFSVATMAVGLAIFFFIFKEKKFQNAFYALIVLMLSTALFGIPTIDKMLSSNSKVQSLVQLREKADQEQLNVYIYAEYSPEVWFKYQKILPEIFVGDSKTYPKEKTFYIATNSNVLAELAELKKLGWKLTFTKKYDDNEEGEHSKNYSERKIHYVYLVEK